jgi:hypothetical protein
MEELIRTVAERAGIDDAQAARAVETVLDLVRSRLPGPIADQLESLIGGGGDGDGGGGLGDLSDLADKASDLLGGLNR